MVLIVKFSKTRAKSSNFASSFWPIYTVHRCLKPSQMCQKFNSDDFPFFQTSDRTSGSKVRHFRRRTAPMIKSGLLRPNLFCLFGQNDRQTLGPHPGDVRGDFEWRRSYYLPRNPFFLLPASLPASFEKWVKSILLPRKLTDEHANTLGQLPDGVCRWLKSHRSSLKAFGPLGQALPPLPNFRFFGPFYLDTHFFLPISPEKAE